MLFLLPKTNHEQARLVADRIHRNIEPYSARNTVLLEIRLGVVQYKQGESMTDFLTRALPAPG
jgi:PleD family two-component response regulator